MKMNERKKTNPRQSRYKHTRRIFNEITELLLLLFNIESKVFLISFGFIFNYDDELYFEII